jgi:hypothetical protein
MLSPPDTLHVVIRVTTAVQLWLITHTASLASITGVVLFVSTLLMTLLVLLLLLLQPTTGATGGREGLGGYRSTASALNVWRQHRYERAPADIAAMC